MQRAVPRVVSILSLALVAWVGSLALIAPCAAAQDEATDTEARARFEAGRQAFTAGHYDDALSDFRRAYELSHRPVLLYNIGETCARLERRQEALEAFETYLREMPGDAPQRAQVESRVAILRRALEPATPTDDQPTADQPTPAPAVAAATSSDPAPWIVLAVAGAVAIAGAVVLGVAEADRSSVQSARPPTFYSDAASTASEVPVLDGIGIAALAVGVVGAIAAVVWGVMGSPAQPRTTALSLDPHGFTVRWSL